MKVLKFGGSSVGSIEGLHSIKDIVTQLDTPAVVVVSALGGVTDQLIAMATAAREGRNDEFQKELSTLIERHHRAVCGCLEAEFQGAIIEKLDALFDELSNILRGVSLISDLSPRTLAAIVAYGERLSSIIVAAMIPGASHAEARGLIKTEPYFSRHIIDFTLTNSLLVQYFGEHPSRVTVMGGFISSDKTTGEATNLGRGGSDYTAAIVAAALGADQLYIYTDVDGFMTADPRVIDRALLIERLSFVEAMELCNFGAKVIYPPTIFPAYNANIPIIIRNTFNPTCRGTYIARFEPNDRSQKVVKGISSINDTCLLTVRGLGMVGVIGVNYRIFKCLSKSGISVFLVSQASSENTTSIGICNGDAQRAVATLSTEFAQEIAMGEIDEVIVQKNLATVAVVGEGMRDLTGVAGKLFGTLGRAGINIIASAQGAAQTNISFVTELASLRKAIAVLHSSFFLSEYRELNLFLTGVGLVGDNLLQQIEGQQKRLMEQNGLKINIVGISNSKRMIFDRDGLDLKNYKTLLAASGCASSPESLVEKIVSENIFNSVFVDCTAAPSVAALYDRLLEHNVSVVTANKIAASSDYAHYSKLKNLARARDVKFLFETNVGAGLPIIGTINDLCNSGDKILGLEAVVSGTLNYIFNVLAADVPLSKAIMMARQAGYAEPDPRIDLSGMDVMRKLVILTRESGYQVEIEDVQKELFIPSDLFSGSLDEFWARVPSLDQEWEAKRKVMEAKQMRWRFVAAMSEGKCRVSLQEVGKDHPFYNLEGSNNIILIHSSRYREYPLQIKGYGAGAGVTAAGVFADIMSIANIR
ncbi:MAG: bifunctional aspartate kinase/homoserine dehydrogenase I [Mucinivorans sp.]